MAGVELARERRSRARTFHTNPTKSITLKTRRMEGGDGHRALLRPGRQQPLKGAREGRRRESTRRRNCDTVASFVPHVRHMT
jgi:hypothetical protein